MHTELWFERLKGRSPLMNVGEAWRVIKEKIQTRRWTDVDRDMVGWCARFYRGNGSSRYTKTETFLTSWELFIICSIRYSLHGVTLLQWVKIQNFLNILTDNNYTANLLLGKDITCCNHSPINVVSCGWFHMDKQLTVSVISSQQFVWEASSHVERQQVHEFERTSENPTNEITYLQWMTPESGSLSLVTDWFRFRWPTLWLRRKIKCTE